MIDVKIQVGLTKKSDLDYFISNADEFYCGLEKIPSHLYYVRTFRKIDDIIEILSKIKKLHKKLFLVANEIQYSSFNETISVIKLLIKEGIDGIIVRDIGLLKYLKENKIRSYYILSSLSLCFNLESLRFYKELGIRRIAIPEQITSAEAKYLIQNPFEIETEVFLTVREYCGVLNGFCYLKQFTGKCLCRATFKTNKDKYFKMPLPSQEEHLRNLYRFIKMGTRIIKIGRHPDEFYGKIVYNEALTIMNIFREEPEISEADFLRKVIKIDNKFKEIIEKCKKIYKRQQ